LKRLVTHTPRRRTLTPFLGETFRNLALQKHEMLYVPRIKIGVVHAN
jgi:hypothetical protein